MSGRNSSQPQDDYEWELIAGHILGDLSDQERESFESLELSRHAEASEGLARTAAALHLAMEDPEMESMPDRLRAQILADAPSYFSSPSGVDRAFAAQMDREDTPLATPGFGEERLGRREMFAWLAFAAALLAAIVFGYRASSGPDVTLTVAEAREALVTEAPDLVRVAWSNGKTPFDNPVVGDVVWSNDAQQGFMRFEGMPINDPTQEQYQLWIIDPDRDDEPIDGGVFDVTSSAESIVQIDAKLRVLNPAAFAITIEKPGGVVVSSQDRLPLIAALN
jgi:hypothetical protein